jgi:hypothetical protein
VAAVCTGVEVWDAFYSSFWQAPNRPGPEIAVCRPDNGGTCFNSLRSGKWIKPEAVLFAFDLIEVDGEDLRREPIEARTGCGFSRTARVRRFARQYSKEPLHPAGW